MSYTKRPLPIGKKFNKLIILQEIPTKEKCRRYVYCLCDCGSKKVLRYDRVKSGDIKSCGCLLSVKNKSQIEKMVITRRRNQDRRKSSEYINKKFNKLTIESIYHHPKYNGTWFNVKCDCGNKFQTSLAKLKKGHTKSCGCIRRKFKSIQFISEVDGEIVKVSGRKDQYYRILNNTTSNFKPKRKLGIIKKDEREHFHIHEAKKIFKILGKEWSQTTCIHHIDGDKLNNKLNNLAIFENNGKHHEHHKKLELKMFQFLQSRNLLQEFYKENPELRLQTLSDLISPI